MILTCVCSPDLHPHCDTWWCYQDILARRSIHHGQARLHPALQRAAQGIQVRLLDGCDSALDHLASRRAACRHGHRLHGRAAHNRRLRVLWLYPVRFSPHLRDQPLTISHRLYLTYKYMLIWVCEQPTHLETNGFYYPYALGAVFAGLYVEEVFLTALFILRKTTAGYVCGGIIVRGRPLAFFSLIILIRQCRLSPSS